VQANEAIPKTVTAWKSIIKDFQHASPMETDQCSKSASDVMGVAFLGIDFSRRLADTHGPGWAQLHRRRRFRSVIDTSASRPLHALLCHVDRSIPARIQCLGDAKHLLPFSGQIQRPAQTGCRTPGIRSEWPYLTCRLTVGRVRMRWTLGRMRSTEENHEALNCGPMGPRSDDPSVFRVIVLMDADRRTGMLGGCEPC